MRDWKTGDVETEYSLKHYEETWGNVSIAQEPLFVKRRLTSAICAGLQYVPSTGYA
jgi:hypothetical protein